MNKFSVIFKLSFINTIFFYLPILANNSPVDYVNTLVGTQSKFELSTGNTYPAIAMPWGMNFWTPQTGDMGDGWTYTYNADKIKGFKQTHQPSPWMNDYGQFALMPVTGGVVFEQNQRASWFSHKAEIAKPYYYKVYLDQQLVQKRIKSSDIPPGIRGVFPKISRTILSLFSTNRFNSLPWPSIMPSRPIKPKSKGTMQAVLSVSPHTKENKYTHE